MGKINFKYINFEHLNSGYKIQLGNSNINISSVVFKPSSLNYSQLINWIHSLVASGTISSIAPKESDIVLRVFTVPNKLEDNRMIIDLSKLKNNVNKVYLMIEDEYIIKYLI